MEQRQFKGILDREFDGIEEEGTVAGIPYVVKRYLSYLPTDTRFPTNFTYDVEIAGEVHNFIGVTGVYYFLQGFKAGKGDQ